MATRTSRNNVQKVCTLWTHEPSFSPENVVINLERVQELGLASGALASIIAIRPPTGGSANRDAHPYKASASIASADGKPNAPARPLFSRRRSTSITTTFDEGGAKLIAGADLDTSKSYVVVVKDAPPELKARYPALQISISSTIAAAFGFRNRTQVVLTTADEASHAASHVEIKFKDEYLSRADMWRLAIAELSQKTVYRDQRLLFLGTIKAVVKNVWINGQRRRSGYFNGSTKPIFRSESAKFVVFIQMSKEMGDFDTEGSGEIMFNKVINGFLPELFKKWEEIKARHLVSIILFSRLGYDASDPNKPFATAGHAGGFRDSGDSRDFYRVVVSEMASNDWINILYQLKKEFLSFERDISVQPVTSKRHASLSAGPVTDESDELRYEIVGKPVVASRGNILEAINLASSSFSQDYIDRDLVRTGISVIVITAGTGVYEVDYAMLKLTTDTLMGSGMGIDLVCLSPMPLHSTPLFKYRNPKVVEEPSSNSPDYTLNPDDSTPRAFHVGSMASSVKSLSTTPTKQPRQHNPTPGEWSYAMPQWIDVSFWRGTADEQAMLQRHRKSSRPQPHAAANHRSDFALRCRMYELQMMGFMENEMESIYIAHLHNNPLHPWHRLKPHMKGRPITDNDRVRITQLDRSWMDEYDDNIFKSHQQRHEAENRARKHQSRLSSTPRMQLSIGTKDESDQVAPSPSFRPGAGYLDWKIKEKSPTKTDSLQRRGSKFSLYSAAENASIKSSKPRNISFGRSGLAAALPTVTADLTTSSSIFAKPAVFSKATHTSSTGIVSGVTQQFRAALNRSASQSTDIATTTSIKEHDAKISKPIDIDTNRRLAEHNRSLSSDAVSSSAATSKDGQSDGSKTPRLSPDKVSQPGAIMAASHARRRGHRPDLPLISAGEHIPQKLSPTMALSPWMVLLNPCNPKSNDMSMSGHFRRWQHVFPRQLRTSTMKWQSLCTPASVPLTNEYFPSAEQLQTEYQESPYRLSQNTEDDQLSDAPGSREALIRELIGFRLAHGFQLVVGPAVAEYLGSHATDQIQIFDKDYMAKDSATVFMSVGGTLHQLTCTTNGEVEVRRFNRKPSAAVMSATGPNAPVYRPYIRTALQTEYKPREIVFKPPRAEYNWNYIDTFLAGYHDEFSETLKFWRARFVLIPVDIPQQKGRQLPVLTEDSAEEIRLEGIRKLTHILQRHRVVPPEERTYQSMRKRKDPNPLAIEYQTRDPSAIVATGAEGALLSESDPTFTATTLFLDHETYATKGVDLTKLASDLQGEHGIKMLDRRWHLRLYYNCFLGQDFTTWLLDRFRDIETRDDAVSFGNELMQQGLFQHVQKKHQFRDGQYFYHIAAEYRAARPETRMGWFSTRRGDKSVPATPMTEAPRTASTEKTSRNETMSPGESTSEKTPVQKPADAGRQVMLSHVMRYDVDPRKKSYRTEHINLHYDRLHNPDNCYHIRIDWMNATAKFIEDAIGNWATSVERFGLKLVELPIAEAVSITETHPFRAPYLIKLAVAPPASPWPNYFDTTSFTPHSQNDKLMYHKALLKRLQFVLDMESMSSFPSDVDVTYSWGKPDYRYTQFIHKSGLVLAQITDEGHFLLLANRLCNNRISASRASDKHDVGENGPDRRPQSAHGRKSPLASPLTRPVQFADPPVRQTYIFSQEKSSHRTAEEIKEHVEAFCLNADALRAFYEEAAEARRPITSPSPRVAPTPLLDSSVPSLRLPPNLSTLGGPLIGSRRGKPSGGSEDKGGEKGEG